ncbi:oxygen-independent coproporphyrinogen III oxidase [Fontimonas sp. SYSU GA230001]|uniref:oxygen-independent coproporphyrinogen III oxidase n=1 Tax=Fontimonas sp. SYSU GA230001 TaxID=3142450 RepID=UPI0032B38D25
MPAGVVFAPELIRRYGGPAPRYTSYPTALQFTPQFGEPDLRRVIAERDDAAPAAPLSVYLHVPFCSSPCYYCGCTRVITRQPEVIEAYVRRLIVEIGLQAQLFGRRREIVQLHFGGGTPTTLDAGQFGRIMGALDRHFGLSNSPRREYSIEIDPRTLDDETMPMLAALGFNRVSFGVQDFDPAVQEAIHRVQPAWQTWRAIDQARSAGFASVSLDLIYGLPRQTPASFARTLDQVAEAGPDRIAVYAYAHMPQLFRAQRRIALADLPTPETRLELLQLSIDRLTGAGYVYIGMDHFARPDDELAKALADGTLQRNFQGYSTQGGCDLLALGMSAISHIGGCYSQNSKDMKAYAQAIDAGHLPVVRGLRLTDEDELRRGVIEDLMCRGAVDIAAVERTHHIDFETHFAEELRDLDRLAQDGLVARDARHIRVSPAGRLLIRRVAQTFDAYTRPTGPAPDRPASNAV